MKAKILFLLGLHLIGYPLIIILMINIIFSNAIAISFLNLFAVSVIYQIIAKEIRIGYTYEKNRND
jgi:hypothetical protein